MAGAAGVADETGGGGSVNVGSGLVLDVVLAAEHQLTSRIAVIVTNNMGLIPAPVWLDLGDYRGRKRFSHPSKEGFH